MILQDSPSRVRYLCDGQPASDHPGPWVVVSITFDSPALPDRSTAFCSRCADGYNFPAVARLLSTVPGCTFTVSSVG